MKTVGQLLHTERNRQNISIGELSSATRIDPKYIEALEADRYDLLPSETFAKGFIRNIALTLNADPNELVAVFRRDFRHPDQGIKKTIQYRGSHHSFHPSTQLISIALGVTVFIIYLGFQFRVILTPPPLSLSQPLTNSVTASPIDVQGTTSTDSLVTINDDIVVKPDQDGHFQTSLNLAVGETTIKIKATNRFSRSTTTTIPITIISK